MAKRIMFMDIETNAPHGDILEIACVLDKKTKRDPIVTFHAYVKPTAGQWLWSSIETLQDNGLTWDFLQEHGQPTGQVLRDFVDWLKEHKVIGGRVMIIGHNTQYLVDLLMNEISFELQELGFPFEELYTIEDYYSILVNRRQMPLLSDRTSRAIAEQIGVEPEPMPAGAIQGVEAAQRNYERLMEYGIREE